MTPLTGDIKALGKTMNGLPRTAEGMAELAGLIRDRKELQALKAQQKRQARGGRVPSSGGSAAVRNGMASVTRSGGGLRAAFSRAIEDQRNAG